jgi:hypothetical protein
VFDAKAFTEKGGSGAHLRLNISSGSTIPVLQIVLYAVKLPTIGGAQLAREADTVIGEARMV